MALPYSPIDVANLALDRLGQPSITDFNDGTKAANLAGRMFPLASDFIQRRFPWRKLRTRASLAPDATAPDWGYQQQYTTPGDMLRLLEVYQNGYAVKRGWELEGDKILINYEGQLNIRYIRREADTSVWDSLMISAVAAYMAKDMAEPLTQDPNKKQFAYADFEAIMTEAKHANAQEGTPTPLNDPDRWELVRVMGGSDVELRPISEVP